MTIANRATLAENSLLLGLSGTKKNVRRYIVLFEQTGDVQPVSCRSELLGDCEELMLLRFIIE